MRLAIATAVGWFCFASELAFFAKSDRYSITLAVSIFYCQKTANWRPISLINYDAKLLSKALAERLKLAIPSIIKNDQTAYVKNRFLGGSVRLISDILEFTQELKIEGYIMTIDIEKAFDSVDHTFLFAISKKFNFHPKFINWIKVLTNSQ